jgi:ribosomal protein S14
MRCRDCGKKVSLYKWFKYLTMCRLCFAIETSQTKEEKKE